MHRVKFAIAVVLGWSLLGPAVSEAPAQNGGVYCPKCGKVHAAESVSRNGSSGQVVYSNSPTSRSLGGGGVSNVLDALNAQRARQGVRALMFDSSLQSVAERRAQQMASSGQKGHPPGSFSPGTHEGVGWSSSYSPSGVSACYTSDSRMQFAGAAMATGRDGVYFAVVYR